MTAGLDRILGFAALAGAAACLFGLWLDPGAMLASYLTAWFAIASIPIGAIGVLLTSYLVKAGWTRDLHAPLTGAALTMPAVALLFVPVLAGLHWIYPWADGASLPAFKAAYLAPWFYIARAVFFFAVMTALATWATRAYGDESRMTRAASAGLIAWSLVVSWSGIDWLESVEADFHSSIYGLLTISFTLLSGTAFGLVAALAFRRPHQMSNSAYGGVLLSLLLLWAYLYAMQYIVIWAGNIPDETIWYLKRLDGGWGYALWAMFIGQFLLPFFALLSARVRSSTRALMGLATATLALRPLESAMLVLPPLHYPPILLLLDVPAALLATGAGWLLAWRLAPEVWQRWSRRAAPARQQ